MDIFIIHLNWNRLHISLHMYVYVWKKYVL